jgi:hypothetical protein
MYQFNTPAKVNKALSVCIASSVLIHIAVRIKVSYFRWKFNLEHPSNKAGITTKFQTNFENQSLSDFATNIFGIIMLGGVVRLVSLVNSFNPEELNIYPNYYYVYGLHLFAPVVFCSFIILTYYFHHKPLQTFVRNELKELLAHISPF